MNNRSSFPDDQSLKRLEVGLKNMRVMEHESVIAHALLANHVTCVRYDDKSFVATIFSNLVVLPENAYGVEQILLGAYQETSAMIKSLLNNIPGFQVELVAMMPEDIVKWLKDFQDASLHNKDGGELYSTMKSGMWHVKYSWVNPFTINTSLIAWDIAMNYLYDTIRNNIYREGYEGEEGLRKMLELELIKIEQHPYSKGSFSVCFNKQLGDHTFAPCLAWFGGHSQVYESGKNDFGYTNLFYISNDTYIGSWYAIKETGPKQYLRLNT